MERGQRMSPLCHSVMRPARPPVTPPHSPNIGLSQALASCPGTGIEGTPLMQSDEVTPMVLWGLHWIGLDRGGGGDWTLRNSYPRGRPGD